MALAILEFITRGRGTVSFSMDTGTNGYYQLKIGSGVAERDGLKWIDSVSRATPILPCPSKGRLLDSQTEINVPANYFDSNNSYVQLFSYKNTQGKSPSFSQVLKVPASTTHALLNGISPSMSLTHIPASEARDTLNPQVRRIRQSRYSSQASLDDLLGQIVRAAAPVVLDLFRGKAGEGTATTDAAATSGSESGASVKWIASLLGAVLKNLPGNGTPGSSKGQSIVMQNSPGNRFLHASGDGFSRPMLFGIDDAIIGSVIGKVVGILPQVMNSANQKRVQLKQADNKLMSDLVSTVNQRMLMEQLLAAQKAGPSGTPPVNAEEIARLLQLLQQSGPTASPTIAQPASSTESPQSAAAAKSLSFIQDLSGLSKTVVLTFEDLNRGDETKLTMFSKNSVTVLKVKVNVAEPRAGKVIPRAIFRLLLKLPSTQEVLLEKTFKKKAIIPNGVVEFSLSQDEIRCLPVNKPLSVFAEIRWQAGQGKREYKALGSSSLMYVGECRFQQLGESGPEEKELTDMNLYRSFWNKIWESPVLDRSSAEADNDAERKTLWALDTMLKYEVSLSPEHDTNGLVETRTTRIGDDTESLTAQYGGRMKAGIELSVRELNKLRSLWSKETPLSEESLEAFSTESFAEVNRSSFIRSIQLKGKARERGMVWVIPVFSLRKCILQKVQAVGDTGEVKAFTEEETTFPLPTAARVIGLKSDENASGEPSESEYAFEGYSVEFSEKVALIPVSQGAVRRDAN